MATVRAASLAARPTEYANVALATAASSAGLLGILNDNKSTFFGTFNTLCVSLNYGTSVVGIHNFNDSTWVIDGAIETPGGELLCSVRKSTDVGELWRSTGFNPANPTSNAPTWTRVLQCSGVGNFIRARWGLNRGCIAPSWSRHAGAMFINEYGTTIDLAGTPTQAAIRAWMTTDDGVTLREIFNLYNQAAIQWPTETRFHVHGITYDPWIGRVLVSHGDGGNATPGHCGIWYSDNPEATTPTWTLVPGSATPTSDEQVSSLMADEAGIVMLSDGQPNGMRMMPRRRALAYGAIKELSPYVGYNQGPIGSSIYRIGGLSSPSPGSPMFACFIESNTTGGKPAIFVSTDGFRWREFYRHSAATSGGAPGFERVFGPTVDGKIIGALNLSGTSQVFQCDYLPKSLAA